MSPRRHVILAALGIALALALCPQAAPAKSLKACKLAVTACGCEAKKKAGHYVLQSDLTSSSPTLDCLTVKAAYAVIDLNDHSITGPGGAATNAGIHVLSSATGAFIGGNFDSVISGFGNGITVESSHVAVVETGLSHNAAYGLMINGGSSNTAYDLDAGSSTDTFPSNGVAGVLILNGSNNLVDDINANNNGMYGIELSGGANNAVHDSDGNGDGRYGIWVTGSNGARIVNSEGVSDGQAGLYVGCAPSGAVGGSCSTGATSSNVVIKVSQFKSNTATGAIGLGVDTGNLAAQIGLNVLTGNQATDAVDANAACGTNLWFQNTIGTASQSCIH